MCITHTCAVPPPSSVRPCPRPERRPSRRSALSPLVRSSDVSAKPERGAGDPELYYLLVSSSAAYLIGIDYRISSSQSMRRGLRPLGLRRSHPRCPSPRVRHAT